jgi:hypothetical protein
MTTYLYPADPNTSLLRTNRFENPSFETDTVGLSFAASKWNINRTTYAPRVAAGEWAAFGTTLAAADTSTYLGQYFDATPGEWVAVRINAQRTSTGSDYLRFRLFADTGSLVQIAQSAVMLGAIDQYSYWTSPAVQVPAGTTRILAAAYVFDNAAGTAAPVTSTIVAVDGWLAAGAATQGEAASAVGTYFDGDTPGDLLARTVYEWTGTPHASTSTESWILGDVTPKLVMNYEDERPTGAIAFQTITGSRPVIVRRNRVPLPTGTLEMLCENLADAEQLVALCDGSTDVVLASDDVPDAPWTFAPVDAGRLTWNTPYDSWTVRVPYVRLT